MTSTSNLSYLNSCIVFNSQCLTILRVDITDTSFFNPGQSYKWCKCPNMEGKMHQSGTYADAHKFKVKMVYLRNTHKCKIIKNHLQTGSADKFRKITFEKSLKFWHNKSEISPTQSEWMRCFHFSCFSPTNSCKNTILDNKNIFFFLFNNSYAKSESEKQLSAIHGQLRHLDI